MALATQLSNTGGIAARLSSMTENLRAAYARRRTFKQTVHELSALSNRELNDLGLSRSDIRRIAWQAAYDQ